MKLIKCFETEDMPDCVYEELSECLESGEDGDRCAFWIDEVLSQKSLEWFLKNGATKGEKVLIERGLW